MDKISFDATSIGPKERLSSGRSPLYIHTYIHTYLHTYEISLYDRLAALPLNSISLRHSTGLS